MFFTIKSNVYTLRNFRISLQFSWRFLASPLLHAASHLPLFSLVSSLVFLVKVLVNKCPLYLRVLGLYSYRRFGVFSFFFYEEKSAPPFFSMAFNRPWKRKKWCIYSLILPNYTLTLFFFLYNWSHPLYIFNIFLIWFLNYYIYLFCISFHHSFIIFFGILHLII
jgi:hypothetical protein